MDCGLKLHQRTGVVLRIYDVFWISEPKNNCYREYKVILILFIEIYIYSTLFGHLAVELLMFCSSEVESLYLQCHNWVEMFRSKCKQFFEQIQCVVKQAGFKIQTKWIMQTVKQKNHSGTLARPLKEQMWSDI